jgi:hypothetical protein
MGEIEKPKYQFPDPKKTYTPERIQEIRETLRKYIDESNYPQVAEFAYTNHIPRQTLYELTELRDLIDELHAKKETQLEKGALTGKFNAMFAKFAISQRGIGWRETQTIQTINANVDIPLNEPDRATFKKNLRAFFPTLEQDEEPEK